MHAAQLRRIPNGARANSPAYIWRMAANGADQREPYYTNKTSFKQAHVSPVPLCMSPVNRQHKGHVTIPQRRRVTVHRSPTLREKLRRRLRCHPSSVTGVNLDAEKAAFRSAEASSPWDVDVGDSAFVQLNEYRSKCHSHFKVPTH